MQRPYKTCRHEGCDKPATRVQAQLCENCYGRMRRRGTTDYWHPDARIKDCQGYWRVYDPNHPLANRNSRVYEHRLIAYQHYGPGRQTCGWCGCGLTWGDLHIDHLDDDRDNNHIGNLVISCGTCNRARTAARRFFARLSRVGLERFLTSVGRPRDAADAWDHQGQGAA